MADETQKTLIDVTALKYFYKSLQNVTVLIAPSTVEAASSSNIGHVYLIPADGTYAGIECKMGDHIVSNGTAWVLIPKGTAGDSSDYSKLENKPSINEVELNGSLTSEDLGLEGAIWVGTSAEYEAEKDSIADGTKVIITDDEKEEVILHNDLNERNAANAHNISAITGLEDALDSKAEADHNHDGVYQPVGDYADKVHKHTVSDITDFPTSLPASNTTNDYDVQGTDPVSGQAVAKAIAELPEPMVFKGSVGTNGTIVSLPPANKDNMGFTYKVITDGTYAGKKAKAGDTFISDGTEWILIPSGDEPSGTVISVGMTVPTGLSVSDTPITESGVFEVTFENGYSIPTDVKQTEWSNKENAIWKGTKEQYESAKSSITDGTKVIITDDFTDNGVVNHNDMLKRDAANAHPISAIAGLQTIIDNLTARITALENK